MKTLLTAVLVAALPIGSAVAAAPPSCSVQVDNNPLVIRLNKDEFRIAFGVSGESCPESGCSGLIRYQAAWRAEDGTENVESKLVGYAIPNGAGRSIAVDRHYFDFGEARHTTDLVRVTVDDVSCSPARLTAGR